MHDARSNLIDRLLNGGAEAYNLSTFAESLPENLQIEYRYAGQGTLWTDAKASLVEMAA